MRLRTILASLMAVVLLSLSCAASACAVNCDAMGISHTCSHTPRANAQADSSHSSMSGMQHCSMKMQRDSQETVHLKLQTAACSHHVCAEQPVILTDETGAAAHPIQLNQTATPLSSVITADLIETSRISETPPLRSPSLIALQSTLRI